MNGNSKISQQEGSHPAESTVFAPMEISRTVTDLGIAEPKTINVASPITGPNVSMTVNTPYGGPIVSLEQGSVNNVTGPNA